VKQTREISIQDRVFGVNDLRRFANVIETQDRPKTGNVTVDYEVTFSDNTRFESDTPNVFEEELLTAHGRAVAVDMTYWNYSKGNRISVRLSHGDSTYRNEAIVSGLDANWVNANFQALQDVINRATPQNSWLRRHGFFTVTLIALGIGSAFFLLIDTLDWTASKLGWFTVIAHPSASWIPFLIRLSRYRAFFIALDWFLRWFVGQAMGAYGILNWLRAMWPRVEFDIGPSHLQIEKIRRRRLSTVFVLVVIPILVTLAYDIIKRLYGT